MDDDAYRKMKNVEDAHWWFRARRRILGYTLKKLNLPDDARLLEAGCGSGGNLAMLARHGKVSAFESDKSSLLLAEHRGRDLPVRVLGGSLPNDVPYQDELFDAVLLLDVLEHISEDGAALLALRKKLKPGGVIIVTVPAFMFLWSEHDTLHHHFRRYRTKQLASLAREAGFVSIRISYFNSILFPLVAIFRIAMRLGLRKGGDDLALPSPLVNRVLEAVFAFERFFIGRVPLLAGSSVLMTARHPENER